MLKQGIGFFTTCIGAMMGDSENLIIPVVIILIGIALMMSDREEK